jgi:hypothetical protein
MLGSLGFSEQKRASQFSKPFTIPMGELQN